MLFPSFPSRNHHCNSPASISARPPKITRPVYPCYETTASRAPWTWQHDASASRRTPPAASAPALHTRMVSPASPPLLHFSSLDLIPVARPTQGWLLGLPACRAPAGGCGRAEEEAAAAARSSPLQRTSEQTPDTDRRAGNNRGARRSVRVLHRPLEPRRQKNIQTKADRAPPLHT